jgi:hypothetical protein
MWRFTSRLNETLLLTDYGYNEELSKRFNIPFHGGVDISIGLNDPVYSFVYDTAKVSKVNPFIQDEGTIVLTDVNNYEYVFGHLDNIKVQEKDLVQFGSYLGDQDSKGQSVQEQLRPLWQHIHFSVRKISEDGKYPTLWNYGNKYENTDNKLEGFIDPNENCLKVVYRVAEAICQIESGWNKWTNQWNPKAMTLKENNNPAGLRYSPFQQGKKNGFAVFDTSLNGFKALVWDLENKAKGNTITKLNGKSTIKEFTKIWAPVQDGNNPFKYAESIVRICGFRSLNDRLEDWLLTELDWVRRFNNEAKNMPEGTFITNKLGLLKNFIWNKIHKG